MPSSRFGLQAAINRWVNVNQSNVQLHQQEDDVSIRHGETRGAGGVSVPRKTYPRKQTPASTTKKKQQPAAQDDATTVCSGSTLGTSSQATGGGRVVVAGVPSVAGAGPWPPMVALPASGSFPGGGPLPNPTPDTADDASRASSKRRKRSSHLAGGGGGGGGDAHSVASSVASAPIPGAVTAGPSRFPRPQQPTPPPSVVAPGVFYGVEYGVAPIVHPPASVGGGGASSAASVGSQRSRSSVRSAPALATGGGIPSSSASVGSAPLTGPPPMTSLVHPLCPGAPSPSEGSIVIKDKRPPPPLPSRPAHNHASGVTSLPGSVVKGKKNKVRGIKSSSSVNMMPNNKKPPPVVLEFRDWSIEKNSTAPTPLFPPNESPSPPPPTPGAVFGVRPPLLVSVPSGRQLSQAAMMTNNRINVEPLAPAPTPPMSPPAGVLFPPPPVGDTRVGGMVHFVHSGPAAASSSAAAAAAAAGTGTRSEERMADLEAKMEAALVLTSLPLGAPARTATSSAAATTTAGGHSHVGVESVPSSDSEEKKSDNTSGAVSSDGYDGSGEEDGNRDFDMMDIGALAPRKLLKGGKRGKARSSSPWGRKAKNLADAALLEYQTLAEQQQERSDGKAGSSGSKNRNRFNSSRLKRTNSKTRVYQQAPLPPPPGT